ncbi:hypothetical protein ABBQ38_009919 [Trebouxia sp. C0009 RCD-2024]
MGENRSSSIPMYEALAQELAAWPQLPNVPDHVWCNVLSQMEFKDFAKLSCVSSSLTVPGSTWELLRSVMAWSDKVRALWHDIVQIRGTINRHRRIARNIWRSDGTRTPSVHYQTLSELASHCDMARRRASGSATIIKPLKKTYQRLCDELESVLSQHSQSDSSLAFEIDVADVRKAFQAAGSDCRYDYASSGEGYDSDSS